MSWRFGSSTKGHADFPTAPDVQLGWLEMGGSSRSISGRLNSDRKAVKRTWGFTLRSWLEQTSWQWIVSLYTASRGPYELWDSLNPNELTESMAQGLSGWRVAAGGATNTGTYRFTLDAGTTAIQTAKTSSPPPADLFAVPADELTFSFTMETADKCDGAVSVWGYPANGVGVGTMMFQQVFTQVDAGRINVTGSVDSATYPLYAIRITRSSGTFQVSDFGLFREYDRAPAAAIVPVMIQSLSQVVHNATKKSTLSIAVEEI